MGGGVEIRHKSVSGDFYFASAEAIEDLKELPPPISDQVEILSHAEILESIERGELSVDEAVEAVTKIDKIDRSKCRLRVESHFSIDCMVSAYEKVYEQIFRLEEKKENLRKGQ